MDWAASVARAERAKTQGPSGRALTASISPASAASLSVLVETLRSLAASVRLSQGSTPSLMDVLRQAEIDLVILDLMLPGRSSFDLCGDVRAASQEPIMMLTARSEESDRVVGLKAGADDYVTKPFSQRELLAASGRSCADRA